MKNNFLTIASYLFLACILTMAQGCKKEYTDPNTASDEQVFSSAKGLTGVATGLQRVYTLGRGSSLYNMITINGLVTNELFVVNTGNTAEVQLQTGGNAVDPTHTMLATFWASNNKVIYDANLVITNAAKLADKSYGSGLIAYASIFKALSLGNLSEFWQNVPDTIGTNVKFITSQEGYRKAVKVLDNAIAVVSANAVSASFLSSVPAGIDITNTLYALKARYALFAGDYAVALAAANTVDLTKKSTFNFDALSPNPIFDVATSTNNVVQVKDSTLGLVPSLAPSLSDGRVPFYTAISPTILPRYRIKGFGASTTTAIPVYLPGEMTLIKAEVYARQNDSTTSKTFLNAILTKTAAADPFGVGANLPPMNSVGSYANLLDQIYRNRSIELYMSGLKLEDMRRFNRPTADRRRNFMPYPFRERDNNPNTPADPPF